MVSLYGLTIAFLVLIVLVFIFIMLVVIYGYRNYQLLKNGQEWHHFIKDKFLFSISHGIDVVKNDEQLIRLLKKKDFQELFISVLIESDQKFVGYTKQVLNEMFYEFHLDNLAWEKLNSKNVYDKVRGIQVFTAIQVKEALPKIKMFLNNPDPRIYTKAQYALVRFNGFEGLHFLDKLESPLSEWQQMRLLSVINEVPESASESICRWLQHSNPSVIQFALTIVRKFRLHPLHDKVFLLLVHPESVVRRDGIRTLQSIETPETLNLLMAKYPHQEESVQLAILQVIKKLRNRKTIDFLKEQLQNTTQIPALLTIIESLKILDERSHLQEKVNEENTSEILKKLLHTALA